MASEQPSPPNNDAEPDRDYVDRGVPLARLVGALCGILALVVVGLGIAAVIERAFAPTDAGEGFIGTPESLHDAPRVDSRQAAERRRLDASQNQRLSSYGWVDQQAGIAHVPIDTAIDALVRRHAVAKAPVAPEPTESSP